MDANTIAIVIAIAGVGVTLAGIGITVLIILLRGLFRLGQLFQRVDAQDENIRQLRDDIQQLRVETRDDIQQLRVETRDDIQQLRTELRDDIQQLRTETRDEMREMRADIQQLTAAVRQTNEMVIALANHRHDQDGNIIFILPPQPSG